VFTTGAALRELDTARIVDGKLVFDNAPQHHVAEAMLDKAARLEQDVEEQQAALQDDDWHMSEEEEIAQEKRMWAALNSKLAADMA